jgi:TetR/AcrR family transcriptional repressor of mexJK operon
MRRCRSNTKDAHDRKRETILTTAQQVFMEEGYSAASMSAIAARVGGSKGTLYNYFHSKANLFVAVMQNLCVIDQTQISDVDDSDIRTFLIQLAGRFARLMLSEEALIIHRVVVAEAVRFPEVGQALYDAGPRRSKTRLMSYLEQAMTDGRLKPGDPERQAEEAMELCLSGLYRRRLWNVGAPPTEAEIDANVRAGVDTFLAAHGPDEERLRR